VCLNFLPAQTPPDPHPGTLFPGPFTGFSTIGVPILPLNPGCSITVTFIDHPVYTDLQWTPAKKAAVEAAVRIWEKTLHSRIEIRVDAVLSEDLKGSFASTSTTLEPGTKILNNKFGPDVMFPSPLADVIANRDLSPGVEDITILVASDSAMWHLGKRKWSNSTTFIDSNEVSLVTAMLHEIGHGLIGQSFAYTYTLDDITRGAIIYPKSVFILKAK
jgi:hypothetical protein